ncbi:hypothetical protein EOI86_18980 [Hwanghaeella grinnelliae]|uniref:DUF732 domain-containing protein n=1 Tax=Hwanghaeella grinnelliae TaxID=2500179 RepID=A0A437QK83_9PROT|nr:hypothetical protein [Hwanghaeella grinnelliae]RVU34920.1 hypothetical protein EOI86_18980 [Hwanghaeella grinnelliae]
MRALLIATVAAIAISAWPASAQVVQNKKTCFQAVEDAKQANQESAISEKAHADVAELIRVSEHLCTQANFVYAESLLAIARGMTAQE